MEIWLIFVLALSPALFWLWFFYKQDAYEPEPLSLLARLFFLGMAAAIIALICEVFAGFVITGVILTVLAGPIIEECVKFFMVWKFAYGNREFNEPMDGIVYATAVALGFATLENVVYFLAQSSLSSLVITGGFRAILSVPGHALFSVFWGYALGIAKFSQPENRNKVIFAGLALGIALHIVFNYLLAQAFLGFTILLLVMVPLVWWFAEKRISAALLASPFSPEKK
jgi:protease PrsW